MREKGKTMSIEETIKDRLVSLGMFPQQVDVVIGRMKENEANDAMQGRWGDSPDGYPEEIMLLAWYSAKEEALRYIDECIPKAWFRPMFAQ